MKNFITSLLTSEPLIFAKGAIIFIIGPINSQLAYLLLAVAIDLIFGIQVARKNNTFKWRLLFDKIRRKLFVYMMWISMFHAFDMIAGLPNTARWSVVVMLAGMELISAAKNTAQLGHGRLSDAIEGVYLSLVKGNPALNATKEVAAEDELLSPGTQEGEDENEDGIKQKHTK